jgi:hypothetical protein
MCANLACLGLQICVRIYHVVDSPTWLIQADDDENKPVWSTWAVGVLLEVRVVETYNRGRPAGRAASTLFGVSLGISQSSFPSCPLKLFAN